MRRDGRYRAAHRKRARLIDRMEVIVPELPDVEHFKHVLEENGLHRIIKSVAVKDARILGELPAAAFAAHLTGHRLVEARRHGKHLMAKLDARGWLTFCLYEQARARARRNCRGCGELHRR